MPLFKKTAIIGVGLIGGSLALGIKKRKLSREVVGISRHSKTISLALKMKAIDKGSLALGIIKGADLVIIATPVNTIIGLRKKISRYIGKGCVITDVGSTKEAVFASLGGVFPSYIGSHPLAGSEKSGVINASPDLFKGSLCVLTSGKRSPSLALKKIEKMWKKLGAKTITLTPKLHDRNLAFASHLPHAVAYSLMKSIPADTLKFSAGGLRDTTRIAASDPLLWRDIFLTNKGNLLKAIGAFQDNLNKIKSAIKRGDARGLQNILLQSKRKRELLG